MWVFQSDLAQPLCAHNWFRECGVGLCFIPGFCEGDWTRHGGWTRVGAGDHECGVCLGNSSFNGVSEVRITTTKFASEVVQFGFDCVCVEDRKSEVKSYQLKRLLQDERRDAKFDHCNVWGGEAV